jgi:prophage tail gpP-like protein
MSNEVTILIDGEDFRFWSDLEINRPLDSFDTFSFTAPFDPDSPLLRGTFEPFSYKPVEIKIDGELLITGVLFIKPRLNPSDNTISCSGYSTPGVLNDCEFSPDSYPLEFDGLNLQGIANAAAEPFGIDVVFDTDPGVKFDQVAAKPGSKILSFLIGLAKQRGPLISDSPAGELVFFTPVESGAAVAAIHQDQNRFLGGDPTFNEQQYFSSVTGLSPNTTGLFSEKFTVENPHLSDVLRPHTFNIKDTTDIDIQTTVKAKAGRMFADAVGYEITVQGWRDDNADIWAANKLVKLLAPGIMVYNESELLIKSVGLKRASEGGDTATLGLVLPGVYSGKIPEVLPWEL